MSIVDKAKGLLHSEKGEKATDAALDKAADAAKQRLGQDKADKIDKAREAADRKLGTE